MEAPKLLVNKPKKSQLKQVEHPPSSSSSSSSSASMATSSSGSGSGPQPPKESFARRYRFLWPLLLAVNLSVGAYLFMRTKKTDVEVDKEVKDVSPSSVPTSVINVAEKPSAALPMAKPIKPREPIPEDQQRELFKWLLEEKRTMKPRDAEDKKRIEEEKSILKQFIRSKYIPTL